VENLKPFIGRLMLISTVICFMMVLMGGIFFLVSYGHDPVPWHKYTSYPTIPTTYKTIGDDLKNPTPLGIVQLGLLVLLLTQVARVALTAWLFLKARDKTFAIISFFVLLVLLYCAIWRF